MTGNIVNLQCPCGHSGGHFCPLDWTDGKYLQPSAPGRHTVDTITDPALHRLYDERDMYARDWKTAVARAEQAEATIERVHAMCDAMEALARASFGEPVTDYERGVDRAATCVRTSLNPPEES
ncbi:hypothetical protein [Streptomyces sp. NPDC086023]|uniref:hypothetical protein n=1 Tax=Streptomyces sp. NPDC086023 TaxID=3365746 RepID=UPI0037D55F14